MMLSSPWPCAPAGKNQDAQTSDIVKAANTVFLMRSSTDPAPKAGSPMMHSTSQPPPHHGDWHDIISLRASRRMSCPVQNAASSEPVSLTLPASTSLSDHSSQSPSLRSGSFTALRCMALFLCQPSRQSWHFIGRHPRRFGRRRRGTCPGRGALVGRAGFAGAGRASGSSPDYLQRPSCARPVASSRAPGGSRPVSSPREAPRFSPRLWPPPRPARPEASAPWRAGNRAP